MPEFTAFDGARLFYAETGDGLPVLALSGLTRNGGDFDYLAPHLSGIRLITMDYRGRGRSEWTGPETYQIPIEAGDALALLDHLGLKKAAILGTSRGGLVAMVPQPRARRCWSPRIVWYWRTLRMVTRRVCHRCGGLSSFWWGNLSGSSSATIRWPMKLICVIRWSAPS